MLIKKLGTSLGVEISELNIKKDVNKNIISKIVDLLSEFSVVVIRAQNINNEEHITFSELFGNLELTKVGTVGSGSKVIILRNFTEDGTILPVSDRQRLNNLANQVWHSDSSFKEIPSKTSILSAKIIPKNGGNTDFLSMRAVYKSLPDELKNKIDSKICWHDYSFGRSKIDPDLVSKNEKEKLPPIKQRMVLTSKRYGKSLYLGAHCSKIDGMGKKESAELLLELNTYFDNKSFIYSHVWKPYDLIMWDNRAVLHRATPIIGEIQKRLMVRTTIAGKSSTLF